MVELPMPSEGGEQRFLTMTGAPAMIEPPMMESLPVSRRHAGDGEPAGHQRTQMVPKMQSD